MSDEFAWRPTIHPRWLSTFHTSSGASSASSSPEDAHHGAPSAEATDYPRPRGDSNGGAGADGEADAEHGHQEEQGKRKNKKGIKSDEA